jgi:hypothetical protein
MSKLKKEFSTADWKDCCAEYCNDCKIAKAYKKKFGKKEGKHMLRKDRKKVLN